MMGLLIGIAGPKRAGKDTLAQLMCARLGMRQDSFAAPLRRFVSDLLGIGPDLLEQHKETPIPWLDGVTPRHMMQTVGTEWGRQMVHPDLWVRAAMARTGNRSTVFSDVRFPNEAKAILDRGGILIAVDRPGTGTGDAHVSETPLPDDLFRFRVCNVGTPADLLAAALDGLNGVRNINVSCRANARIKVTP